MIKEFVFNKANLKKLDEILKKYPSNKKQSAVIPLLELAQRQNSGYISQEIIEYVAKILDVHPIRVHEVASFYSMFNLKPVGKYHIQVCNSVPCCLNGSDKIIEQCKKELQIQEGETTEDGNFTLTEVECLGACINASVVRINDDYYENLDESGIRKIIKKLEKDKDK